MSPNYKLNHAKHNKEVCEFIKQNEQFNDWVVTTAFYSSIHFLENFLFPNNYEDPSNSKRIRSFTDFDSYCKAFRRSREYFIDKHTIRLELVEEVFPEIANDYQTLMDTCFTARYKNYIVDSTTTQVCYQCLEEIEDLCTE